ncbi:MAG: S-layer homology domain-containing protein [Armatimonadetes bacterium]|nr:MAG: S-layer homology domain-containing protein [Armatimonadota bacterium]
MRLHLRALRFLSFVALSIVAVLFMSVSSVEAGTTYIDEEFESVIWDDGAAWWNWLAGDYISKTQIAGVAGNGTRITMKPGEHSAAMLNYQFSRDGYSDPSEAWFRYWLRFDDFPEDTGKLPGFMALYSDSGRAGVRPSESKPGWSARVLFGPGAGGQSVKLGYYLYWLNQQTTAGDKVWWSQEIPLNEWACVEGRVSMNTPGQPDGELDAWINGDEVLHRNDILYRTGSQGTVRIRDFMFTVLYGGPTTPARDTSVSFDGLQVAGHRVGCGSTVPGSSFEDTADSPFVADIEWLAAEGITKGCNPTANTRFCPNQAVTRGQMAAFLRRALDELLIVPPPPDPPPKPPTMWGVDVSDYKASLATMDAAGHPIDIVHVAYPLTRGDWLAGGPSGIAQWAPLQMTNIHDAGAVPFATFSHDDINGFNAGRYDVEFDAWLDSITGWLIGDPSRRLLVAPFANANNQTLAYGDNAPAFRTAYRKVYSAIRGRGVGDTQVRFVYQMADELNSSRYAKGSVGTGYGVYSPGAQYIDLAAISSLNTGSPAWDDWDSVYNTRIAEMNQQIGDDIPVLLAVVGSIPGAGSETRAEWLSAIADGSKTSSTALGFIYFDRDQGAIFSVGTSTSPDPALLDALEVLGSSHDRLGWVFNDMDAWRAAMRASSMSGLFSDDDGSVFEADIAWLSRSGITRGCGNRIFCPDQRVTRGQMAAFLHRALGGLLTPSSSSGVFTDTGGSEFAADIEWLASTGITKGCNPPANDRFCPDSSVTRGQMAAFLHRGLGDLLG